MYKARNNVGLYQELKLLLDYIESDTDLNLLDTLLVKFRNEGLSLREIRSAIYLINKYLPAEIECDRHGCYLSQDIDGMKANTPIDDINAELVTPANIDARQLALVR